MRLLILFVALLSLPLATTAREFAPHFVAEGPSYQLEFSFSSTLPVQQLMEVLFHYNHVEKYGSKTNLQITLVEDNLNTNKMKYHYDYKVAELDLVMNRTMDPENKKVTFKMSDYKRSNFLIPNVLLSGGTYEVKSGGSERVVVYKQNSTLDKSIGWIYQALIKKESRKFIEEMVTYIRGLEKEIATK